MFNIALAALSAVLMFHPSPAPSDLPAPTSTFQLAGFHVADATPNEDAVHLDQFPTFVPATKDDPAQVFLTFTAPIDGQCTAIEYGKTAHGDKAMRLTSASLEPDGSTLLERAPFRVKTGDTVFVAAVLYWKELLDQSAFAGMDLSTRHVGVACANEDHAAFSGWYAIDVPEPPVKRLE